jgi:hypothetical protein
LELWRIFSATHEISFAFVGFLVIEERRDVLVSSATNIANVGVGILHVFPHMNHHLKPLEAAMAADITFVLSKFKLDLSVVCLMFSESLLVGTCRTANQTNKVLLVRLHVGFEVVEQLKVRVANPASSRQLLPIEMHLSVMFLLLILVSEDF